MTARFADVPKMTITLCEVSQTTGQLTVYGRLGLWSGICFRGVPRLGRRGCWGLS